MPRQKWPRLRDGDALEPWHLNVIFAELERLAKFSVSGGLGFINDEGGPRIWLGGSGEELRPAKLPSGGIAAGASGTVEFYTDFSFATLSGETVTAYNNWSDAANPTSRKCAVKFSGARYQVILWGCT